MSFARTHTVALWGIEAVPITVECRIQSGLPAINIVGLPDTSIAESRERVRAAITAAGQSWPSQRITVALTPADQPKSGSGLDVAIAIAICGAAGIATRESAEKTLYLGELGLDGHLHPIRGVLPAVIRGQQQGFTTVVVPLANAQEARMIPGITIRSVGHFSELIRGGSDSGKGHNCEVAGCHSQIAEEPAPTAEEVDMADVYGQAQGRLALELAAAGGHHVLLNGPPGVGKTMLAQRLPTIMPDLTDEQALEVMSIHSIAGTLPRHTELIRQPPFVSPHHTSSRAAMVGGGSGIARPGAISRAHRGVLFLDEAPEFSPNVLDCLRQPLERGHIVIDRIRASAIFPTQFTLVLAANPCPCGYAVTAPTRCSCTPAAQRRYQYRLSGPLLDRIDIRSHVSTPRLGGLMPGEDSAAIRTRVIQARERQTRRYEGQTWQLNVHAPGSWLRDLTSRDSPGLFSTLIDLVNRGAMSLRGMDRTLRLAWTLADLTDQGAPRVEELDTAITLRGDYVR